MLKQSQHLLPVFGKIPGRAFRCDEEVDIPLQRSELAQVVVPIRTLSRIQLQGQVQIQHRRI